MGYFIAGSIFVVLSIVWFFIQENAKRNKKHEEATSDGKKAVHNHDVAGLFKSLRDRMLHR